MTQPHVSEQPGSGDIKVGNVSGTGIAIGHGAIVTIYQTVLRPLPVNLSSLVRPLIEHYTAVFGGRDAELAGLDAFLADPQHPFGLLFAPTGLGKTALLVHWMARVQQQHPQWRIIFAPVSIRYHTASEQVVLGLLAHSLAEIHNDVEQFRNYDQSPSSLRALITDYLHRPLPPDTHLLVVLDGIDEAIGWTVGPLCAVTPQEGLKIVVAARQRANTTREDYQQQLGWTNAPVAQLDLQPLDLPAVAALLRQSDPALADDPAFVAQFYRVSEGDPLTCNLLVKALSGGKITPGSLTQRPPGLEAFLKDWVEALRKRRQASRPIRELLALCAVAYGPLASDDLQALAPEIFVEQSDIVDAVHDDEVARFIITVGEHTYVFSHQRLREVFLEQIYPPKDRDRLQQRLIAYGDNWYNDKTVPLPDYLRLFWVAHLKEAGLWARMRQVLTEIVPGVDGQHQIQPWQTARYVAEGSDTGYLSDLDTLWSWAEQQQDLRLALRCSLLSASLRSRSGNLTPELLVLLVQIGTPQGRWSAAAILEQIALMPDADNQAASIKALLATGMTLHWERALDVARAITEEQYRAKALADLAPHLALDAQVPVLAEALQVARAITDESFRARALTGLAPHLTPSLLAEALQAARAILDQESHVKALTGLAPHLTPTLLAEALQAARAISDEEYRTVVLTGLAPHLPPTLLTKALQAVHAISDEEYRTVVLTGLAPHLPPALLAEALQAAHAISDEEYRTVVLTALAPHLAPSDQAPVLAEALRAARAITVEATRAEALTGLAPHLPPALLAEALQAARAITVEEYRAEALTALAPHLPPTLLAEVLQTDRAITDERFRAEALTVLAPHLPPTLLAEALQAAHAISDEWSRATALAGLAPHLPPTLLAEALQAVRAISVKEYRARALTGLAPHLAPGAQVPVLAEALQAAHAISDEWSRAEALTALAPHLALGALAPRLAEALHEARTITSEWHRARALTALAPHLPPTLLTKALQAARTIADEENRAKALTGLIPHMALSAQPPLLVLKREGQRDDHRSVMWQFVCQLFEASQRLMIGPTPPFLTILAETLQAARAISDEQSRAAALTGLAPHLPPTLLAEALQAARAISDEKYRGRALTGLAPHLPPNAQAPALAEALQAAHAISDERSRAEALAGLAPYLPPTLLAEALQVAHAISDELSRAEALAGLAPHLPPTLLAKALQVARAISDERPRTAALTGLAPHLTPGDQAPVLAEALQAACTLTDDRRLISRDRSSLLPDLAPILAQAHANDALFFSTLRILARWGRPALLRDLHSLLPWLTEVAADRQQAVVAALADAIVETGRCWP